jgi:fimbrial chaperone protein
VSPVRVDLDAGQPGTTVTLGNTGTSRATVQVEVYRWRQADGADQYDPTDELLVNPPLFFIEPGASQIVRIGLASNATRSATQEQAFRVYFREVVPARASGAPALDFALRIGIPVFIRPSVPARSELVWSGRVAADGTLRIAVENRGMQHTRIAEPQILPARGSQALASAQGFRYVLSRARQEWVLQPGQTVTPGAVRVVALTESGTVEYPLVLEAE